MLTRENFIGPWAGLPVSWTEEDGLDIDRYREDVRRCGAARVPGIYTGGTTGEFYAMEFHEFQEVARVTVEQSRPTETPVMIGVTSTYTRGAEQRAAFAAEIGADAIQVALPYWMEVADEQVIPFLMAVSAASGHLPLSIYETTRTKKTLTLSQHQAIHQALPNYLMVKANEGTIGCSAKGCEALSKIVNVFVGEHLWKTLWPHGARGSCSSIVYWNPRVLLAYWDLLRTGQPDDTNDVAHKFDQLSKFLARRYQPRGFTDTAYDRMGATASGFLNTSLRNRGPYVSPTEEDRQDLHDWYAEHFPEMLQQ